MKAVLISVQPQWCEKIKNIIDIKDNIPIYEKSVEIRKTKPKIDTPFKCYIYETKAIYKPSGNNHFFNGNGKVIGEFVCDDIRWANGVNLLVKEDAEATLKGSCLTIEEIYKYLGVKSGMSRYDKKTEFYRWHISDLVIYDKPKELSEFCRYDNTYDNAFGYAFEDRSKYVPIKRPPQSWCYVVRKEDEGK